MTLGMHAEAMEDPVSLQFFLLPPSKKKMQSRFPRSQKIIKFNQIYTICYIQLDFQLSLV